MCLAIPGKITSLDEDGGVLATVEVAHVRRRVNVDLLREGGLDVGDWVLIHVGFAMSKISEQEAREQMRLLNTLGETREALEEVQGYGSEGLSEKAASENDPFDPLGKNPFADASDGKQATEDAPPEEAPGAEGAFDQKAQREP